MNQKGFKIDQKRYENRLFSSVVYHVIKVICGFMQLIEQSSPLYIQKIKEIDFLLNKGCQVFIF